MSLLLVKPSQVLRETQVYQVKHTLSDGKGGFCAKGAILNYLGWDGNYHNWNNEAYEQFNKLGIGGDELVHMNDKEGKSFSEIADYLESREL